MGRMFNALGILPGDDLIEAKASDLVTGYAGQAGKCTREILRKSLGGVLFIDEAYQMDPARGGPYMTEAVDEMVGALTEEEFKGKLLVILAGYSDDMEKMLKTNPGLKSRFSERVMFEDFDAQSVTELLVAELKKSGVPLEHKDSKMDALLKLSNRLINESGSSFGNGRDCVTWSNEVYKIVAKRFSSQPKRSNGLGLKFNSTLDDIENALDQFLVSSRVQAGGQSCGKLSEQSKSLMATTQQKKDPPPLTKRSYSMMKMSENEEEEIKLEQKVEENIEEVEVPNNIFDGFDSNVLNTLQAVIDELGIGSEEGARQLKNMNPNSKEFANLLHRLQKDTGMSYVAAKAKLTEWQSLQENLEEMIQKEKIKTKTLGARPIWRCGVCGRADKPWIACYVAPFIVRYEKIPLDG
jgi:rubrerythrin